MGPFVGLVVACLVLLSTAGVGAADPVTIDSIAASQSRIEAALLTLIDGSVADRAVTAKLTERVTALETAQEAARKAEAEQSRVLMAGLQDILKQVDELDESLQRDARCKPQRCQQRVRSAACSLHYGWYCFRGQLCCGYYYLCE